MSKKMKKNKAMRTAGGLFVATMLSTSIISGTYAKYVTEDEASDNARVAVFGVKVEAEGTLFDTSYLDASGGNTPATGESGTVTVQSLAAYTTTDNELPLKAYSVNGGATLNNVVAPGTKSDENGLSFSVSGTPEVTVKIEVTFDNTSDIYLGENGTNVYYPNMTNGDVFDATFSATTDVFNISEAYYPVEFKLTKGSTDVVGGTSNTAGTLANVEAYIANMFSTAGSGSGFTYTSDTTTGKHTYSLTVPAGTDIGDTLGLDDLTLTWEWKFETDTETESLVRGKDKEDTLLGDLAYDKFANNGEGADEDALVGGDNGAIAAIKAALGYEDWTSSGNSLSGLTDQSGKPVGGTVSTTDAYNLIANFDMTISVVQVD